MVENIQGLSQNVPVTDACNAIGFPHSTFYRITSFPFKEAVQETPSKRVSHRALDKAKREEVRETLNSTRFMNDSPAVVYATLLDEGDYLCSISTMYRILRENDEVQERRNQRELPTYTKPELLATAPNQLWSWDISWLKGPSPGRHYYIYTILDVFSRYIVGWTVEEAESAERAKQLIEFACQTQSIRSDELVLHSDRGAPMRSIPVAHLLEHLGVTKSHSRPYVSNDNPYSEAHFKTMKYRPDYPQRFESLEKTRLWARSFIDWYNFQHHHSGLGLNTPASVHSGQAKQIYAQRQSVLDSAHLLHPERFVNGPPQPPALPVSVWINKPTNMDVNF